MKDLTDKQKALLSFIEQNYEERGIMPTLSEISSRFSYSDKAAWDAVDALARKGFIEKEKRGHRAMRLNPGKRERMENARIPFYSDMITAASITGAAEESVYIEKAAVAGRDLFAIRVQSLSMKNAGILPGDIAVLDRNTSELKDNDIVLAEPKAAEDNALMELRRFRRTPFFTELWPENDSMGIIKAPAFSFYGRLIMILRSY